ncbi:MAG: thermonuclease family protein [Thermoanaerobaculia bacterium]
MFRIRNYGFSLILLLFSTLLFPLERAKVIKVYDGDTIKVILNEKVEKVRLIGIDCPERDEKGFWQALNFTKRLVLHKKVYIEYDAEKRDKYGRLLAYVFLEDGKFINEEILKEGHGKFILIPPNDKYKERLKLAEEFAISNNKGIWKKKKENV